MVTINRITVGCFVVVLNTARGHSGVTAVVSEVAIEVINLAVVRRLTTGKNGLVPVDAGFEIMSSLRV